MAPTTSTTSASLQIPSLDTSPGPSRQQYSSSSAVSRPVSVSVHPTPTSATSPPSASRKQRASHTVVSSSQQNSQNQGGGGHHADDTPAYHDVYSHPAAVAYAAAHPRRTIPKFGPYLLLQTLGEGEFGKVKLGLHSQWGEEVAVKLIRRGNVDNSVRMSKVEREIEVLRTLKHPNIVRLYDVIETDKYIGIILEYASGGELFDHILAHRYLKEKDAAKLFSQLISGVWYIHQKKIVHRDLKLENLLLDRHRNVIITDFGFANRFEHRADDLMQTSCGSPCYAAPELVISEGLYVGSAVDIWSCGVILYAMLAGYLPFDDDPANPDGDNINLLYKYIVNTPLSFPEYISDEARDLLSMMLVPDPTRRSTLEGVMQHPWLAAYATMDDGTASGIPTAFGKNVEELERAAMEQHQMKRLAYQRQMKAAAAASASSPSSNPHVARSQSHQVDVFGSGQSPGPAVASPPSSGRSRSVQPEYLYETSMDQSYASSTMPTPVSAPTTSSSGRKGVTPIPAPVVATDEDDPFAAPRTSGKERRPDEVAGEGELRGEPRARRGSGAGEVSAPSGRSGSRQAQVATPPVSGSPEGAKSTKKSVGSGSEFRHTIQVEYDAPQKTPGSGSRRSEDRERRKGRERTSSQGHGQAQLQNGDVVADGRKRRPSQGSATTKPLPPSPPSVSSPSRDRAGERTPTKNSPVSVRSNSTPVPASSPIEPPVVHIASASPPGTPITFATPEKEKDKDTGSQGSKGSGHRRGLSSADKYGLGKIFGAGTNEEANGRVPSDGSTSGVVIPDSASGGSQRPSTLQPPSGTNSKSSSLLSPSGGSDKEGNGASGKKSRRNTLTVMVEPISRSIRNRTAKGRMASTPMATSGPESATSGSLKEKKEKKTSQSALLPATAPVNGSGSDAENAPSSFGNLSRTDIGGGVGVGPGMGASTSKAKKVMEWFRTKSKGGRESGGLEPAAPTASGDEEDEREREKERKRGGTPTQATYRKKNATSSSTINQTTPVTANSTSPMPVFVTTPPALSPRMAGPQRAVAPIHAQRTPSSTTDTSFASPLPKWLRTSVGVVGSSGHTPKPLGDALRIHHGAVDMTTITTRPPPEVMKHMKEVLEGMGVEIQVESEFKYRCIRMKRKKGAGVAGGVGLGSVGPVSGAGAGGGGLAAFTMVGSAASNGVDKRGLPVPSQSSFSGTGGMLRGLLMRRQSSQVSASGTAASQPSLSFEDEAISPTNAEPSSYLHEGTVYGDPTHDAGDEVRFSVELTRLDRLNDTYSLDIRRLKGNLRSYKFLYDTLRERADLQRADLQR